MGRRILCLLLVCLGAWHLSTRFGGALFADFQSQKVITISAEANLTDEIPAPAGPIRLAHTPATQAYPVSRRLILQGVASQSPISISSLFNAPLAAGNTIQVQLFYKTPGSVEITTVTQRGRDPFVFSFEVPKAVVTRTGVMYRLFAQDLSSAKTAGFPSTDPDEFQLVSVGGVTVRITPAGGQVVYHSGVPESLTAYGKTMLDIPAGALDGPVDISIEEVATFDVPEGVPPAVGPRTLSPSPIIAYRITPEGLRFKLPVTLTLMYDTDATGRLAGSSFEESTAGAFVFDGFRWGPIGADQDMKKNTLTTRILHLSFYGVFPAAPLQPEDFRPAQKIITPNGDGVNDNLEFGNLGAEATIDIFDVTARKVRHLEGVFVWDGRDDSGDVVESGVYIYQYKKDGKLVSGVVAVAK